MLLNVRKQRRVTTNEKPEHPATWLQNVHLTNLADWNTTKDDKVKIKHKCEKNQYKHLHHTHHLYTPSNKCNTGILLLRLSGNKKVGILKMRI